MSRMGESKPRIQTLISLAAVLMAGSPLLAPVILSERFQAAEAGQWESLFDGENLGYWTSTPFGGEGPVHIEDGQIVLEMGETLTGITWTGPDLPRINYEISLEARRLDGHDFFCGLTFPVGESSCSLIVGGWGGSVVGLSSLDGMDASENETTRTMSFERGRWYLIRVRVTEGALEAWIDDRKMVDVSTEGRQIWIRPEVDLSRPLGVATWITRSALRNLRLRRLGGNGSQSAEVRFRNSEAGTQKPESPAAFRRVNGLTDSDS